MPCESGQRADCRGQGASSSLFRFFGAWTCFRSHNTVMSDLHSMLFRSAMLECGFCPTVNATAMRRLLIVTSC